MAAKIKSSEYLELEAEAIKKYVSEIYLKKVQEPQKPSQKDMSFWKIAGIEATLFTIAGLGIAVYSAIRTGGLFFIMETLLLQKFNMPEIIQSGFSWTAMVTSLLAFELYVLADGFSKGKKNKSLKRSNVGLFSSLGTIVLAGIFTGLGLIANLNPTVELIFYITIAIVTAIAGGLVALYSGENIGYTVSLVQVTREKLNTDYKNDYKKWREDGVRAYNSSHYALGSKKNVEFIRNIEEKQEKEAAHKSVEKEYLDLLMTSLENFYEKHGRIPEVKELKKLGVTEEMAEEAIKRYALENNKTKS